MILLSCTEQLDMKVQVNRVQVQVLVHGYFILYQT